MFVVEEPEKKICELGKRVGMKMSKRWMMLMSKRRRRSHCPNWSFQRRWSAGRETGNRQGWGGEQLGEPVAGSMHCTQHHGCSPQD